MKWLLCVVMVVLAGVVRADEIRWINPQGGDWNEPGNWDLGRVPQFLDKVVFDVPSIYTVTVSDPRPELWHPSGLLVSSGEVSFDLQDGYFAHDPSGSDFGCAIVVMSGGDSDVHVTFRNGTIFDNCFHDSIVVVQGSDASVATLRISDSVDAGYVGDMTVGANGAVHIDGSVDVCTSRIHVLEGGEILLRGLISDCGGTSRVVVDGLLEVFGMFDGQESYLEGYGQVTIEDGALIGFSLFDSPIVDIVGDAFVWFGYAPDARINFSMAGGGAEVVLGESWLPVSHGGVYHFSGDNAVNPLVIDMSMFESAWNMFGVVEYSSDRKLEAGSSHLIAVWKFPRQSAIIDFSPEMVVVGEHGGSLRWSGTTVSGIGGLYVIGVPNSWCPADLDLDSDLDFFDVARFLSEYGQQSPWANINNDLRVDFFDVAEFLAVYTGGCP